jgi:dolichyl-phosphate beta-glucosyltransferase
VNELPALSVVVPTYNSVEFIAASLRELLAYLDARSARSELIVVDDGSMDATCEVVERELVRPGRGLLLRSAHNRGKGHAVRRGVLAASGERIVFTDADLAYPPSQIDALLVALDAGADVAIADRTSADSRFTLSPGFFGYLFTRHLSSRLFNRINRILLRIPYRDTQAGLKAFRGEVGRSLFARVTLEGFAFDVELLTLAHREGLRVVEVPVAYHYLSESSSVEFAWEAWKSLRDVLAVRRRVGSERRGGRS